MRPSVDRDELPARSRTPEGGRQDPLQENREAPRGGDFPLRMVFGIIRTVFHHKKEYSNGILD